MTFLFVFKQEENMKKDEKRALIFLIPMMTIILGLVIYPIIRTFLYSLQRYKLTEPQNVKFIGVENYIKVLTSKTFQTAALNTLIIISIVLVVGFISSVIVALILNQKNKINGLLTAIAIIPWALPPVVNGIVWRFIVFPGYGLLNKILLNLDLIDKPTNWLDGRYQTLIIVGIIVAWRVVPFGAIILMTNMQSIPIELYEAGQIDGSNKIQLFKNITFPLLIPSMVIVITNLTMNAVNVFDEIIALVGYRDMGQTLLVYNYNETFSFLNFGFGSAITYIIMLGSGIYGYFYIKSLNKQEG